MMLARVADSLYWIGRYVERAEHMCRLSDVMLNATLDRSEAANQVARIALAAVGEPEGSKTRSPYEAALALALDREDTGSIFASIARARENARQVRDQITTETWERLNLIYLRLSDPDAVKTFEEGSQLFLHETTTKSANTIRPWYRWGERSNSIPNIPWPANSFGNSTVNSIWNRSKIIPTFWRMSIIPFVWIGHPHCSWLMPLDRNTFGRPIICWI